MKLHIWTYITCLLWDRHYLHYLTSVHNSLMKEALLALPFYKGGNRCLLKVTEPRMAGLSPSPQLCGITPLCLITPQCNSLEVSGPNRAMYLGALEVCEELNECYFRPLGEEIIWGEQKRWTFAAVVRAPQNIREYGA